MTWMNRLTIGQRLLVGFATTLALTIAVATVGIYSLSQTRGWFVDYRELAQENKLVSRLQIDMLMTRMGVKDFIIDGSQESVELVRNRIAHVYEDLALALQQIRAPERIDGIADVSNRIDEYNEGFGNVVSLQEQRNALVDRLEELGPLVRTRVTGILDSAFEHGESETAQSAALVQQHLLLSLLSVQEFLLTNDSASADRALEGFAATTAALETLLHSIATPEERSIAEAASAEFEEYSFTFQAVAGVVAFRNDIIENTLDAIGPTIAASGQVIFDSVATDQDSLGGVVQQRTYASVILLIVAAVASVAIGVAAAYVIATSIRRPVGSLTAAMLRLAEGDLAADVPDGGGRDEISDMARTVGVFKSRMVKSRELESDRETAWAQEDARATAVRDAVSDFQSIIADHIGSLTAVSGELDQSTVTLRETSARGSKESAAVASIADQTSANVQNVSASVEEMDSSFGEVVEQIARASSKADETATTVKGTVETMETLSQVSQSISEVIGLINGISEQTNLLALNATIEAARAGDAGKGFAVVANEVKSLASQTRKATEEVASKIQEIQAASDQSVRSVQQITESIQEVNSISAAIAAAVEQQKAATGEIARNMQEAAVGTSQLTSSIGDVRQGAEETAATVAILSEVKDRTKSVSGDLSAAIDRFIDRIEAA